MSADEFFNKYSIEEINKKTKISPISLRFIKNREFDKLPRVKFIGFVRLIEKRYKVDLSELIEEYENYFNQNDNNKQKEKKETELEKKEEIKEKKSYLWILVLILFILSAFLYFKNHSDKNLIFENNKTVLKDSIINIDNEKNNTVFEKKENELNKSIKLSQNNTQTKENFNKIVEKNITDFAGDKNKSKNNIFKIKEENITNTIKILPHKLLWFRTLNIDNNKTKEFLTSNIKVLKGNYYIKFGHGNVTIIYNDFNITPNTKKIIRILFKDGNYTFLKKHNEYEK